MTSQSAPNLRDIIKEEYSKCVKDPIYFIKRYCIIQHPIRGKIPFILYAFQENILGAFLKFGRNIILKNRQMGLSTLASAYALWLMTFFDDKNILVIATKQDVAKNIISKVRIMHNLLPSWMKRKCTEDNKLGLQYNNGSKIYASTSAGDSGRSEAVSLLILDEAAFIPGMEELWGALQPTLSTGGDIIVLSTPNGVGNWYHETFVKAEEGKNNFYPITLHWTLHPEKDQAWRDLQDVELGPRLAKQECDGSFLASGDTVIAGELLEWYKQTHVMEPIEKTGFDRNVWIWEYPDYTKSYMLVSDVARGDGKDYSTFHILELETLNQVAEYQGKPGTQQFGDLCVEYGTKYNDALIVMENATVGWAALQRIIDRSYKNIFYNENKSDVIDDKVMTKYVGNMIKMEKKSVPGFTTSIKSRPLIISKMEQYFNERSVIVRSTRLINELFTFIWNAGKAEAATSNYNDDLVMAYAIGLWVRDTALRLREQSKELTRATLDGFRVEKTAVKSTPFFIGGALQKDPYKINVGKSDQWDTRELL